MRPGRADPCESGRRKVFSFENRGGFQERWLLGVRLHCCCCLIKIGFGGSDATLILAVGAERDQNSFGNHSTMAAAEEAGSGGARTCL